MTEKRPLFRPEAVEHHAKARAGGRPLDLRQRRTAWLFRGLLGAVVVAVVVAFTVPVHQTVRGVAEISGDGTSAVVVVPGHQRVRVGDRVTIEVSGRRYGGRVVATGPRPDVALDELVAGGSSGTVTVDLGRASVAELLLGTDD